MSVPVRVCFAAGSLILTFTRRLPIKLSCPLVSFTCTKYFSQLALFMHGTKKVKGKVNTKADMANSGSDGENARPFAPTDPDAITTDSLEALQSDEQRKVLDIVDHLRRQGLSGIVELPQLVVCGDQSSGKSSVLEAITEIPFPRNENLCTRFATEIILRRHATSAISTRITPDKSRPEAEQQELRDFARTITDFTQLPGIIAEATKAMGLEEIGETNKAFARDVLTVEISGPSRPQL